MMMWGGSWEIIDETSVKLILKLPKLNTDAKCADQEKLTSVNVMSVLSEYMG